MKFRKWVKLLVIIEISNKDKNASKYWNFKNG